MFEHVFCKIPDLFFCIYSRREMELLKVFSKVREGVLWGLSEHTFKLVTNMISSRVSIENFKNGNIWRTSWSHWGIKMWRERYMKKLNNFHKEQKMLFKWFYSVLWLNYWNNSWFIIPFITKNKMVYEDSIDDFLKVSQEKFFVKFCRVFKEILG